MSNITNLNLDIKNNSSSGFLNDYSDYHPTFKRSNKTTSNIDLESPPADENSSISIRQKLVESPIPRKLISTNVYSKPLQIWEGTVLSVDDGEGVMHVSLDSKIGEISTHNAEIGLEWVADQDRDLVSVGAVFYLTLFKLTKRSGIQNSQELRFRRRPSWSKSQIDYIEEKSSELLSKMTESPIAK